MQKENGNGRRIKAKKDVTECTGGIIELWMV